MSRKPETQEAIIEILRTRGPHTCEELATVLGKSARAIQTSIHFERRQRIGGKKRIYIAGFVQHIGGERRGGQPTPRYAFGNYQDRKRPRRNIKAENERRNAIYQRRRQEEIKAATISPWLQPIAQIDPWLRTLGLTEQV